MTLSTQGYKNTITCEKRVTSLSARSTYLTCVFYMFKTVLGEILFFQSFKGNIQLFCKRIDLPLSNSPNRRK